MSASSTEAEPGILSGNSGRRRDPLYISAFNAFSENALNEQYQ